MTIVGTFTNYDPMQGTVAGTGPLKLSVEFLPNANIASNFNKATASIKINVLKATPIILWPDPDDIIEGTALNVDNLLNARAGVFIQHDSVLLSDFKDLPGKLDYTLDFTTPVISGVTKPSAGPHTLSVDFTPDMIIANNYTTVTKSISIMVRP